MLSRFWLFCDPMDSSPPVSSVHGISQARMLEWVAISLSRQSSWDSYTAGRFFTAEPPGNNSDQNQIIPHRQGNHPPRSIFLSALISTEITMKAPCITPNQIHAEDPLNKVQAEHTHTTHVYPGSDQFLRELWIGLQWFGLTQNFSNSHILLFYPNCDEVCELQV